jgi:hypothetical protein
MRVRSGVNTRRSVSQAPDPSIPGNETDTED